MEAEQQQEQLLVTKKQREVQLVAITDDDLEESHELLGSAFQDDPGFVWIFGSVNKDATKWMNVRMVDLAKLEHGILQCSKEDGAMKSVAIVTPPAPPTSYWTLLVREGLLKFPLFYGLGALWRLVSAMDTIDRWKESRKDHWYLDILAVLPEEQGKGIGSASLAASLKENIDSRGVPVMLVTSKESNVRLYTRHGFVVEDSRQFSENFTMYFMTRPANPTNVSS
eukprot:TRINITY_DN3660_c0_g1_i1.p1 TRINITY_DN3660_c0_g1~~TRINITY_DN3660_c0_g1_i1.p1  ORF type:complete len:245 (-),score=45.03 TRINITY_DN3660_c0_g1_i1:73-747(-)